MLMNSLSRTSASLAYGMKPARAAAAAELIADRAPAWTSTLGALLSIAPRRSSRGWRNSEISSSAVRVQYPHASAVGVQHEAHLHPIGSMARGGHNRL